MDNIEKIKSAVTVKLYSSLSSDQLSQVENALTLVLQKYCITDNVGELVPYSETESAAIVKHYIVVKTIEGCSERTLKYYRNEITGFFAAMQKPVSMITTNDIRYYIAVKLNSGVSKVTADNTLRILRSFFRWAATEEIIKRDPTLPIKKIKADKVIKKPFSEEELEKLRDYMDNTRDKAIMEFLFSTGARVSEVCALNKSDIDFLKEQCIVFGKGHKERYVFLNAKSIFWLKKYLSERDDNNPALFVSLDTPHDRLKASAIETRLRDAGRECGVENVHPHRFRRTAATYALRRGMPVDQVRQMLGHTQIQTTLLYACTDDEDTKTSHRKYVV